MAAIDKAIEGFETEAQEVMKSFAGALEKDFDAKLEESREKRAFLLRGFTTALILNDISSLNKTCKIYVATLAIFLPQPPCSV